MLHKNLISSILVLLTIDKLIFACSEWWEGYNVPACYYESYSTGYNYPYCHPEGYEYTSYIPTCYPYYAYILPGLYESCDRTEKYGSTPGAIEQPIIILVENNDKYDEFCFDDLLPFPIGLANNLLNDYSSSCTSTWCNCNCCDRRNKEYESGSKCKCGTCPDCNHSSCNSCNKKGCGKNRCCKSECECHSCNTNCSCNCGCCKHIIICEC